MESDPSRADHIVSSPMTPAPQGPAVGSVVGTVVVAIVLLTVTLLYALSGVLDENAARTNGCLPSEVVCTALQKSTRPAGGSR